MGAPTPNRKIIAGGVSRSKVHEFNVHSSFKNGYRNREDITNLPPAVLVVGSQNVLTNISDRVQVRKGYTLDGQVNATISGIVSSYDWLLHNGIEQHLRAWGTVLEYRYVAANGTVTWKTLMSGLASVNFNFADYWNTTDVQSRLLFVNGSSNIYEWSGGVGLYASSTINTIVISGSQTIAQLGFYTGGGTVTINGANYVYTGVSGNTFTGVTPDPTGAGIVVGDIVVQAVKTTANSSTTGLPSTFANSLITNTRQQVYIGSFVDRSVYVSKVNNYTNYSFTAPVRLVGEGALLTLDATPVAFITQEDVTYVSAGLNFWYNTKFTLSADNTAEQLTIVPLKTAPLQAAQSQALVTKIKNKVIFVSNEPSFDDIGRIESNLTTPDTINISDSIKIDFDSYDFTGGSVAYYRQFVYLAVPAESIVRIYNLNTKYWEAPQILPVGRFAIINGELYGHDANVPQTYKLFDGYNDNGHPIDARALFSFENNGTRSDGKCADGLYVEGYITTNTTMTQAIQYEMGSCGSSGTFTFEGTDTRVCIPNDDSSIGKVPLGTNPLGGTLIQNDPNSLPPKFRVIQTFPLHDFYEAQVSFSSIGVDQRWEILAFGLNSRPSTSGNVSIKT